MTTLQVDSNNDLFMNDAGSLVLLRDLPAVIQDCEHYAKSILGEMVYQTNLGVSYFENAFDFVNLEAFRDSLIQNIRRVPDVIDVPECDVRIVGDQIKYTATIQTAFGIGAINA